MVSDVESLDYLNFQLPSALLYTLPDASCASQVSTYTTEASQRTQILPSSLDLSLCSWAEGSVCETSLLTCCAKMIDEVCCRSTTCAIHIVRCGGIEPHRAFNEKLDVAVIVVDHLWVC